MDGTLFVEENGHPRGYVQCEYNRIRPSQLHATLSGPKRADRSVTSPGNTVRPVLRTFGDRGADWHRRGLRFQAAMDRPAVLRGAVKLANADRVAKVANVATKGDCAGAGEVMRYQGFKG